MARENGARMSHVYISHSSRDLDPLLEVHEAFRAASIPAWYPPDESHDRPRNNAAIDDAFAMVVLVSADSIRSKAVRQDIEHAQQRGLSIIPYQVDKARLTGFFKSEIQPLLRLSSALPDGLAQVVAEAQRAYRHKCPVYAVMNLKGGVGKTTVSAQVFGTWQASPGGRILMIDLDPQYNLTQTFLETGKADAYAARDHSVISLFEKSRVHSRDAPSPAERWLQLSTEPFTPVARAYLCHDLMTGPNAPAGRLDLVPGQFEVSKYAFANDLTALAAIKKQFLRSIEFYRSDYDAIVIDTNPNATFLTRCALEAADRVIAPIQADIYSLRGLKLLNQVIQEQLSPEVRPDLSVLFNFVGRSEQSTFEADARNGAFDAAAGFALSKALLKSALPRSRHLAVKPPKEGEPAWKQLTIHSGRGGGLKQVRQSLKAIALELKSLSGD